MSRKTPRERGFTLTELMVTVVIVGVLAAVATPLVNQQLKDGRVRRKARAVVDLIHHYSAEAAATGRSMFLVAWGSESSSLHMMWVYPGNDGRCVFPLSTWDPADIVYQEQDLAAVGEVSMYPTGSTWWGPSVAYLCLRPDGRVFEMDLCSDTGGAPCGGTPINQFDFYVNDVRHEPRTDFVVSVGQNGLARIYRP